MLKSRRFPSHSAAIMELRRRLVIALLLLLVLATLSTSGYLLLSDNVTFLQALYMTVITLAGVGNGEEIVSTMHSPGLRVFNMAVIVLGWAIAAYVLASITTFLVEGEITNIFWRRKMQRRISELKNHYIVCGLGDTGRHAIEELQKTGTPYVVVDSHDDNVARVREHQSNLFKELLYVIGDATDDLVLDQAGISRAKGLIAALAVDKDNLVITVMVRQKNPSIRIVARCTDLKFSDKMIKAGASATVSPNMIGGMRLASEVLRPHVVGFLDMMVKDQSHTLRIEEIELGKSSTWIGKSLGELNLRQSFNLLPMAIKPGSASVGAAYTVNPPDRYSLEGGSVLIVIGDVSDIRRAREQAHPQGLTAAR